MAPLMFDEILFAKPGLELKAEKVIKADAPWFADHFPRKPVLPMTVLLECKLNLVRLFLNQAEFKIPYKVKKLQKIKMQTFVQPGDKIACHLTCKEQQDEKLILSLKSEVAGKRVCVLEIVLGP
jgi:3-hydroxymyristoyl/3-hydroxydecanoyl-(acyl carrier protein) dehydratase